MPRGRKAKTSKVKVPQPEVKAPVQTREERRAAKLARREAARTAALATKEGVLKRAKALGLFQESKSLKQYEIILPNEEYRKL